MLSASPAYRARNDALFARLAPAAPATVARHERLIDAVRAAPPQH